jgi:hypothetical protein
MIRNARSQDIPALLAMLHEMHAASKYAGRVEISDKAANSQLMSAIAANGQIGPQGTLVIIAEKDGEPVGFMLAVLDRIYGIGNKLWSYDQYLYVRPRAGVRPLLSLIDAYTTWALGIRAVVDIKLAWNDTLPGAERLEPLFERKGFVRSGGIFELQRDVSAERIAA